jgi:hypothetical protein
VEGNEEREGDKGRKMRREERGEGMGPVGERRGGGRGREGYGIQKN